MKRFLNGPQNSGNNAGPTSLTLADKLRPNSLDDYYGQEELIAPGSLLRSLFDKDAIPSMILWGPPGVGKTTLANIIASHTKSHFVKLSAVTCGIPKLKEVIDQAAEQKKYKQHTIVFLDEIHRFNKLQQDALLPHVESGVITLIGATTENPSFECNAALLSRCKVFVLKKLTVPQLLEMLQRGLKELQRSHSATKSQLSIESDAASLIAQTSDGDARVALNALEMAFLASPANAPAITVEVVQQAFQRTHILYDKNGEQHYNIISALHKSLRGSDVDASIYWMARMLEGGEDPKYIARRLIRFASEDIGLADPNALVQANAAAYAVQYIGMPECSVHLTQTVVYLAKAPKSNALYEAYNKARDLVRRTPAYPVPLHICNAPTKLMKDLGYSDGYMYNHDYDEPVNQVYFPEPLIGTKFWEEKPPKFTSSMQSSTSTSAVAMLPPPASLAKPSPTPAKPPAVVSSPSKAPPLSFTTAAALLHGSSQSGASLSSSSSSSPSLAAAAPAKKRPPGPIRHAQQTKEPRASPPSQEEAKPEDIQDVG